MNRVQYFWRMEFGQTQKFFNKEYAINNPKGVCLRIEDMVIVHPDKFTAFIVCKTIEIDNMNALEIFIKGEGRPRELMTDELFKNLEPVEMQYEKDPGLPDIVLFEG